MHLLIYGLIGYAIYCAVVMAALLAFTELGDIARGRGK